MRHTQIKTIQMNVILVFITSVLVPCLSFATIFEGKYEGYAEMALETGDEDLFQNAYDSDSIAECAYRCVESGCRTWVYRENRRQCRLLMTYNEYVVLPPNPADRIWSNIHSGEYSIAPETDSAEKGLNCFIYLFIHNSNIF